MLPDATRVGECCFRPIPTEGQEVEKDRVEWAEPGWRNWQTLGT
jgi:hypothetical protein